MEKLTLRELCRQVAVHEGWHDSYAHFVPLFIREARTKARWEDWDKDVFYEYFERSREQSVSSVAQKYFTHDEQQLLKQNWHELAPLLKTIAEHQDEPQWEAYKQLKKTVRRYTKQDMRTDTNRLVAALQPRLLCSIVAEHKLKELFDRLRSHVSDKLPLYEKHDWFRNSYNLLALVRDAVKPDDPMDIVTYPWQLLELLDEIDKKRYGMDSYIEEKARLLERVKNIVLTGAPGTGKTYLARRMAMKLIDVATDEELAACGRFGFVQFHPSYDYTDFVEGLRPTFAGGSGSVGFELRDGVFKQFCRRAMEVRSVALPGDSAGVQWHEDGGAAGGKYVFVIDEINRGEVSKIFGELFFAIDPGYRGPKGSVATQYANLHKGEEQFYVPENVYIIGTMNDIDRSVESFDFAMRRRFTWVEVTAEESADNMGLPQDLKGRMARLNAAISDTEGLGCAYHVGGAYFLGPDGKPVSDAGAVWRYRLEPLLREYLRGLPGVDDKMEMLHKAYEPGGTNDGGHGTAADN